MKILLTGVTGYIGKRLLPVLLAKGHQVVCCVRDRDRFAYKTAQTDKLSVIEIDFLDENIQLPKDISIAFYLIHSMSSGKDDFDELEARAANNFKRALNSTQAIQVIYLSGIVNEKQLSKHLSSRKKVEEILSRGNFALTTLRAGIVVGSGSASFEIIRDLVEKLPVMVTPKWLRTKSQPVAIKNVIEYLEGVVDYPAAFNKSYDIGGPDVISYRDMLMRYAAIRRLKRWILVVPVMTPRLSSYWLYFVTSTSYRLAVNLVESMKVEIICQENKLAERLGIQPISYDQAIKNAFRIIEQNNIISSWRDSLVNGNFNSHLSDHISVPSYGCFKDVKKKKVRDLEYTLNKIWTIGGDRGWYFANRLWKLRGFLDKLSGGVGLRRGRTHAQRLSPGDALDFWRVLLADKKQRRLLLFAEMKLPGEAWLEFHIDEQNTLHQTATFRPRGIWGRMYWYAVMPLHGIVFNGMITRLITT